MWQPVIKTGKTPVQSQILRLYIFEQVQPEMETRLEIKIDSGELLTPLSTQSKKLTIRN